MTYKDTLDWMFSRLPMYQQKGITAHTGKLESIISFCAYLDNPHQKFKTIHVAGTNGKGSSSHMLASILQEAGYKVGLYTSPHLKDFRERIKINGQVVTEEFVVGFVQEHKNYFEKHPLSFFEMTVGMAFAAFAEQQVDIAIVEVGLGGRLDSTNIINPEVTLITNIGFDHMDMLGDTLEKIAFEKAGIIKEGVPLVVSEFQNGTELVFKEQTHLKKAPLIWAENINCPNYQTDLRGEYQKKNVCGVVAVIQNLPHFKVKGEHIRAGLLNVVKNTGLLGRYQVLRELPKVVCDTAHNFEGLSLVLAQLQQENFNKLHFVIGFVKGKDVHKILQLFPKNA
jgi:dihydrofolate synthase/folylpolyglutamate synthase